ncbi:hypothetical protein [Mycoplasmopsis glycophila]|uniref:Uncharacterized protein n=1 Tax=Mycoplasmopsis glycophila TaxID=171285 RepID=A0A449AVC1_9BACT|nr:hypothetical protein [Mycoplasmopsis glycophila]VEU70461.1 Uncharacterised protein [Mycoplasmopsis glycophila]
MSVKRAIKVRLNNIDGKIWYYPSIWTLSIRKWASRPYFNIQHFLEETDYINQPLWIDINGDSDFKIFNTFQKILKTNIFLSEPVENQTRFEFQLFPKVKLIIPIEQITKIKQGKFFSWPLIDFQRMCQKDLNELKSGESLEIIYNEKYNFIIQKVQATSENSN